MLLFDLTVQVTVGSVFAMAAREELIESDNKPLRTGAFRNGLLYSMFLYVPSAVFFLYAWPGWNSMYLFDIETVRVHGSWFAFLDSVGLMLCYVLGFWFTWLQLRKNKGYMARTLVSLALIWVVVNVILFVLLWGRSFTVCPFSEFAANQLPFFTFNWGQEYSFFGHNLMYWLLFWCVVDFGPLAVIYKIMRKNRRA